jgi:hypothetical protein
LVVVVQEPGTERLRSRLVEELQLVGFTVETAQGGEKAAERARHRPDVAAVVHLQSGGKVVLWAEPERAEEEPVELERRKKESSDLVALRTAEHLRGELLPTESKSPSKRRERRSGTRPTERFTPYWVSLTIGPAFSYSNLMGAGVGPTADAAIWFGRFGIGPFALITLNRTLVEGAPDHLSHKPTIVGARLRALLVENGGTGFEMQAMTSAGVRVVSFRGESGATSGFEDTATALSLGLGVEFSYAPVKWFSVGASAGGRLGVTLSGPDESEGLNPPALRALEDLRNSSSPDGTFVGSAHVTFRF